MLSFVFLCVIPSKQIKSHVWLASLPPAAEGWMASWPYSPPSPARLVPRASWSFRVFSILWAKPCCVPWGLCHIAKSRACPCMVPVAAMDALSTVFTPLCYSSPQCLELILGCQHCTHVSGQLCCPMCRKVWALLLLRLQTSHTFKAHAIMILSRLNLSSAPCCF